MYYCRPRDHAESMVSQLLIRGLLGYNKVIRLGNAHVGDKAIYCLLELTV